MSTSNAVGSAPDVRELRFLWLLSGCAAPPLLWLGQVVLSYGITSGVCYPGDHPTMRTSASSYFTGLLFIDAVALTGCGAAALMSWRSRRSLHARSRFLAEWGLMSSLCFFSATFFNLIASVAVPICPG